MPYGPFPSGAGAAGFHRQLEAAFSALGHQVRADPGFAQAHGPAGFIKKHGVEENRPLGGPGFVSDPAGNGQGLAHGRVVPLEIQHFDLQADRGQFRHVSRYGRLQAVFRPGAGSGQEQ